jgi:hypothetical protein
MSQVFPLPARAGEWFEPRLYSGLPRCLAGGSEFRLSSYPALAGWWAVRDAPERKSPPALWPAQIALPRDSGRTRFDCRLRRLSCRFT